MSLEMGNQGTKQLDLNQVEKKVQEMGREIFSLALESPGPAKLSPAFFTEMLFNWTMADERLKSRLFRIVDVIPSLQGSSAVVEHLDNYLGDIQDELPSPLRMGVSLSAGTMGSAFGSFLVAQAAKKQIEFFARSFIIGTTPENSASKLRALRRAGSAFTLDILGETALSDPECVTYLKRYQELLTTLAKEMGSWEESKPIIPYHECDKNPLSISVKLSALYSQTKPVAADFSIAVLSSRLSSIFRTAKELGAYVYVDMEDSSLTDITLQTFMQVAGSEEFRNYERFGIALQAYLKRTEHDLTRLLKWLKLRPAPIGVRLVKGAYWDTEKVQAGLKGWPVPVWTEKAQTDYQYEVLSRRILEASPLIIPAFASHNIRSLVTVVCLAEALGVPRERFELQMLYGMARQIKSAFIKKGFLVREYTPIGELLPGMGYLVRRLLENTSNESFLRQGFREHESPEVLLTPPQLSLEDQNNLPTSVALQAQAPLSLFLNEPFTDFSGKTARDEISTAIQALLDKTGEEALRVKPCVSGRLFTGQISLVNPLIEDLSSTFSQVELASPEQTLQALGELSSFWPQWMNTPLKDRIDILRQTAQFISNSRARFTAAIILEVGKPWVEADAEVSETIDFLYYYASQAEHLFSRAGGACLVGERNQYFYEPRGITAVISPWNFPLAIPCGMVSAALVTGNCVLFKPAETSSYCAQLLYEAFIESNLPPEALALLPGTGEEIGPILVSHPEISTIAFTGSKEVGLEIIYRAAQFSANSRHVKKVIAEMGGKNAIIVDEDADLDEAICGILTSAFSYQGQKCSACSRVIVAQGISNLFLSRLSRAAQSLIVGKASHPETFLGPVIDKASFLRIHKAIASASRDCATVLGPSAVELEDQMNYCISPVIFCDVPSDHQLLEEEIFGPVLTVEEAKSFPDAVTKALKTRYALTGGVYSRNPRNIAYAEKEFRVGNLYLNRPCTGALVCRQPFGGFGMSGVGSKAGGPDYLMQFVLPRTTTENTIRRGFAF